MDVAQEIKSRLDIADFIAEYLPLKPAGSGTFKAVCPFHQERTPSFHVSRPRQAWHCFGCGLGGDHFTFLEKMEGLSFREALVFLSEKTGVELPVYEKKEEPATGKERLYEVNALAMRFWRAVLESVAGERARAYLETRPVDQVTGDLFELGYAPDQWTAMTDALLKRGVRSDELLAAGLVLKRERGDGVYDRFRGRLMFPIHDVHGRIVGFTGRILAPDPNQPKYMNTPETVIYKKSAVLYGLDKAKGQIRQQDMAVIVEGNMDVITSHRVGVGNVVAASGTALTAEQLALLKRFTNKLAIAFDQDTAGSAATVRGLDLARAQDFSIKIIELPPEAGKDPDEACLKNPELWREAIRNAQGIVDWVYRQAFRQYPAGTAEGKRQIVDRLAPELARISHPVERDHWVRRLAQDLGVGPEAILATMPRVGSSAASVAQDKVRKAPPAPPAPSAEQHVLALALAHPRLFDAAMQAPELLQETWLEPPYFALYKSIHDLYTAGTLSKDGVPWSQFLTHVSAHLPPEHVTTLNQIALYSEHHFASHTEESLSHEWRSTFQQWRQARRADRRRALEQAMREAEAAGDTARVNALAQAFHELNA